MENILVKAFASTEWQAAVLNGRYDIVNKNTDAIIAPETWRSAILPGMDIKMNTWSSPRRMFRATLPRHLPPMPPPAPPGGWIRVHGGMSGGIPPPVDMLPPISWPSPGAVPAGMRLDPFP